ncbi:hypothetical protein [Niastella sp. OAS944]|uniref:hypothetical protein n=1 Tax=Niastella sp. OAS944 TaxID=2664089 RepID=UPI0034950A7D|nr:hypothetical protein [Chitinophagaceae bacterium OAS944]
MTQTNNAIPTNKGVLSKRMLMGAGIGLLLICLFLSSAGHPNPFWPKLWFLRPLIIVPFAGAMGGLCNYYLVYFHNLMGVNKTVAMILSAVIFLIGLWLGLILGLDGTYWN